MNKLNLCLLSCALIGASLATTISCKTCSPFVEYKKELNEEQIKKYEKITNERLRIYIYGLVAGIIVAFVYLYMTQGLTSINEYLKTKSCLFTGIVLLVQYLVYTLYPKSEWMITTLDKQSQREKWLDVYKTMKNRYHYGMVLGIVGCYVLSYLYLQKK